MPIYEYECERCGKITEAMQKFSDPPLHECGHCHGPVHKLISASTFHLKGSGWYVTDYAGKRQCSAEKRKSEQTTKTETKSKCDTPKSD